VACLSDLNALLKGLQDDAMINLWVWDGNGMLPYWVWIGKHELYDLLLIHDISVMGTSWIGGWNMYKVWVGRNSMTLVVRALGGASSVGRNSMDPLKGNPWWCLNIRT